MTTHKHRTLYTALAIAGITGASNAQAVNVSADGRGQVLLYPYYTTRADGAGNAYSTLMSVVNATGSAKAVRVRFLEGKNSREVLDFNMFLSPFDVWTGAILPDPATAGARVGTLDLSCTLPAFSASTTPPFVPFSNAAYTGANDDGAGTGLDRTKEGYFEIIEMATYSASSGTGIAITHVNGIPPCGSKLNDTQAAADALPPSGGLFGSLTLINVSSGTDYTADATALANFIQVGTNYYGAGSATPDLTQATPPISSIQAPDGRLYESTWAPGTADPVSAVLMHDSVINEFVLGTATASGTDWVVTLPTKRYYVNPGTGSGVGLFQRNFNRSAGSCDDTFLKVWDREERLVTFPPPPFSGGPGPAIYSLCWTANILVTYGNHGDVFGSANRVGVPPLSSSDILKVNFQNGWISMDFPIGIIAAATNVHKLINVGATAISGRGQPTTTANTVTYVGLPVIGFAVTSLTNGTLVVGTPPVTVLSNYGGNFAHKFNTTIQ